MLTWSTDVRTYGKPERSMSPAARGPNYIYWTVETLPVFIMFVFTFIEPQKLLSVFIMFIFVNKWYLWSFYLRKCILVMACITVEFMDNIIGMDLMFVDFVDV